MDRPRPIDRGGSILFEVEFRKRAPHGSLDYYNPSSATLTVTDPNSSAVVTTQVLSATNASSAGLFHAVVQTSNSWALGMYETEVIAFDGAIRDYDINPRVFELE